MDAKDLLYRHGEKLAVALVVVLCAWGVWSACTDEGIRPANIKADEIIGRIDSIRTASQTQQPPTLKDAPDHLGDLEHRFANSFTARPVVANLTVHPDAGNVGGDVRGFYYIYELKPPTVSAIDKVGLVEVTVDPPRAQAHDDDRITDKPEASWTREVKGQKIENHVAIVGYRIEAQSNAQDWRVIGEVPADNPVLQFRDVQAFETYHFRASTIIKATGFVPETLGNEVLVLHGAYPGKSASLDQLNPAAGPIARQLAEPTKAQFKVTGAEKLYVSDPGKEPPAEVAELQVGSDLKVALKKVGGALGGAVAPPPATPGAPGTAAPGGVGADEPASGADTDAGEVATVLLYKFDRSKSAADWLGPVQFKHKVGDVVGGEATIEMPGKIKLRRKVDFTTPFVLDRIERGKDRVMFYELALKARPSGGKDKDLAFEKRTRTVNAIILKNPKSKMELELIELGTISRPVKAGVVIYPEYPPGAFREEDELKAHPGTFKAWGLTPPAPIPHAPGTGPLEDLHVAGNELAATDTTYFELPDGRLVYWDNVNHQLGQPLYKSGAEPKATDGKDAKKVDDAPAADPASGGEAAKDAAK